MSDPRGEAQRLSTSSSAQPTRDEAQSDESHNASLSTTPTQSHMQPSSSNPSSATKPAGSTLRPITSMRPPLPQETPRHQASSASSFSASSERQLGSYDDGQLSTIGRGQANVSCILSRSQRKFTPLILTAHISSLSCRRYALPRHAPHSRGKVPIISVPSRMPPRISRPSQPCQHQNTARVQKKIQINGADLNIEVDQ